MATQAELLVVDKRHSAELQPVEQPTGSILSMIQSAAARGDLVMVEKLMDLNDRHDATEARKAFNVSFAAFKGEAVKISRTKEVTDGPLKGKKHAELGAIVAAVTPALSKHGLSLAWRLSKDEPMWMEVTCTLRHVDGHMESMSMGGAPDAGPGRNAIQARGSAKTYLERYTATAILGLAPEDEDNDGDGTNGELVERLDWIANCRNLEELKKIFDAAYAKFGTNRKAQQVIVAAKDKRKAELQ